MTTRADLMEAYNNSVRPQLAEGVDPAVLADIGYDFFEATQGPITESAPRFMGETAVAAVKPDTVNSSVVAHEAARPSVTIPAGSLHREKILGDQAAQALRNDSRRQARRTSGK